MAISTRFLAATTLAGAALLQGCATTGLPQYRSVEAGERTQNTSVTQNGVRRHADGTPVAVNYRACSALNQEIRAATSGNATTRAIGQGTGAIAAGARKGGSGLGDVIAGAAAGVGISILGDQAVRAVNSPRIATLEADCNQEKAYDEWKKDYTRFNREFQSCITKNTGGRTPMSPQEAGQVCNQIVRPAAP